MTLIGRRSHNHPQQVAARTQSRHQLPLLGGIVDATDAVDDRRTPPSIFQPLNDRHRFTVDAAASASNALLDKYWDRDTNGLAKDWSGHRVWCNPPYSDIPAWVEKAARSTVDWSCELVVMLLPANRTEQAWWQDWIEDRRDIPESGMTTTFLRGRHRFGRPAGAPAPVGGDRPPFGLVIVTWKDNRQKQTPLSELEAMGRSHLDAGTQAITQPQVNV